MSKGIIQRKTSVKKDSLIGGDRFSDDEANRRRPCYQLTEKEKQRKVLAMNDFRKNQLGILHEILNSNQRNVNKFVPKTHTIRNTKNSKTRPTSAKSVNTSDGEGNQSAREEVVVNEPSRVSRSTRKDNLQQQYRTTRSQSRPYSNHTHVSFMSDKSNNIDSSSGQFKKLLIHLSSELNNLQSITGFKTNKNDLSIYSSSTALAIALIGLVGHVKQCGSNSKEINNLKDQLSIMIKSQLDFQEKIENQINTLQTMMQTICQIVNNEIISNKNSHQDQLDFNIRESHQNWLNNAQRPYIIEKDTNNAMNELLMFTRRMNNTSPIDNNRHSTYIETLEASKKLTQPISTISMNNNRNIDQTVRHMPLFESTLTGGISNAVVPSDSPTETILEKILQERLRLVQQMNELNKQHEMTQEELANLEAKTTQL